MIVREVEWIEVGGKWTRISKMWDDEESVDAKVVMIPGNPGNEGFYENFGRLLIAKMALVKNERVEFITISHLNHVPLPEGLMGKADHQPHG